MPEFLEQGLVQSMDDRGNVPLSEPVIRITEMGAERRHDPTIAMRGTAMFHLYFHCAGSDGIYLDRQGISLSSIDEAHDHAVAVARTMMESAYGVGDFSDWLIYVADEDDEEVLLVSFAAARPTLH